MGLNTGFCRCAQIDPCISFIKKVPVNENTTIEFHCYNTASLSTIDEKPQSLLVPEASFIAKDEGDDVNDDIVISVFHHKTGWLSTRGERNNSYEFGEHVQKYSQILMCGHEHQHNRKKISDLGNRNAVLYLESDSMQQGDEQSFSLLILDDKDLSVVTQTIVNIDAHNTKCTPSDEATLYLPRHEQSFSFSESYYRSLHNIEAPIKHPHKDPLYLEDIYVYPDLEPVNPDSDEDAIFAYTDAVDLLNNYGSGKVLVLEGENQCGKTALLKMYTLQSYHRSIFPITVYGKDIENINIRSLIVKAYNQQYDTTLKAYHEYMALDRVKRILFIDNMDKSRLNNKGKRELWMSMLKLFDRVIVTTSESIDIERIISQNEERVIYSFVIHSLGYVKRNALIEKWVLLGEDPYCIDPNLKTDTIKAVYDQITNILGKQLLPSNPIFLLTLLQNINIDAIGFDVAPTSYAALYDSLLYAAIIRTGVSPEKVSGYSLFLSELAYTMYESNVDIFSEEEIQDSINFGTFYDSYEEKRNPVAEKINILNTIKNSNVVIEVEPKVYKFSYKYLFFYLTAQKIARLIVREGRKDIVKDLCENLHKEINANILLFLAYLDASGVLLEEIKFSSMLPFEDLTPITLNADDELYSRLTDLVNSMREDFLSASVDPHEHRKKLLEKHDKEDRAIRQASTSETIPSQEEIESDKDLLDFRNTMFVTQIMGQIVKNQQETLEKDELIGLIEDAYNSTFRSLSFVTQVIERDRLTIINELNNNPRFARGVDELKLKDRLTKLLQMVLMKYCLFSFARLSLAVGSSGRGMNAIYDKVAEKIGTPAADFISFTIKTYYGPMKVSELRSMVNRYHNNPVVMRLINARVRNYVYNHELPFGKVSEIGSITGMKLIDTPSTVLAKRNKGK